MGIPRVLNMFENYPFWYTFFTKLKYEVVLSPTSTRKIYELGIESIPSESECYPAKLAHGHVSWLIKKGVKFIFYPCVPYERNEFPDAVNHYNCPIVTSYAENIKNNVDELKDPSIKFMNPFMAFTTEAILTDRLVEVFKDIPAEEVKAAAHAAWEELAQARKDVQKKGEETIQYHERDRKTRYRTCRPSVSHRPGNSSWYSGSDQQLWYCGADRRFCFTPRGSRAPDPCQ